MSNKLNEIILPAVVVGIVGGVFTGIDYMSSKKANPQTLRVTANVEQVHNDVYVPFGERGRFQTKKNSLTGKLGTFAKDTMGLGNTKTGYIVTPTKVNYTTQGGIFFNSKQVEKISENPENLVIISQINLENVLDNQVIFHPQSDLTIGEIALKGRAKSFSVTSGDNQKTYESVIYNPKHFSKAN